MTGRRDKAAPASGCLAAVLLVAMWLACWAVILVGAVLLIKWAITL